MGFFRPTLLYNDIEMERIEKKLPVPLQKKKVLFSLMKARKAQCSMTVQKGETSIKKVVQELKVLAKQTFLSKNWKFCYFSVALNFTR